MSEQFVVTREKSFTAGAALSQYRRVRLSSGELAYAGASDQDSLGVLSRDTFASGDVVSVILRTAQGTVPMIAAGTFNAGVGLYAAADGKVDDSGTVLIGLSLEASTGDGDIVEVAPATNMAALTVARSALTQDDLEPYTVPLNELRTWDDFDAFLPESAGTDDLGFIEGTFGTSASTIESVDFGGTSTTAYGRFLFTLPPEYVDGQTITLRVRCGMLTTVSDTTATIDAACYVNDGDGSVGSDICATAAQSCNSLTLANKDFTITPTSRAPGDVLDIRLAFAGTDSGDAGVMKGTITNVQMLLDIKG